MAANTFRFANMFGDHMVLQRAPKSANLWGYIEGCDQVTAVFNGQSVTAKLIHGEGGGGGGGGGRVTITARLLAELPRAREWPAQECA